MGACVAGFSDYNNDGLIDIYVGNCNFAMGSTLTPAPFNLYRNNGPDANGNITFTDVAQEAGIAQPGFWMSFAPGDYDNDGDLDFFASNAGSAVPQPHAFYRNNGDGTFTDIAADLGIADLEFGWGATLSDFDNDGYLDLYFTGSFPFVPVPGNPGRLFFNDRQGGFNQANLEDTGADLSERYPTGVARGDYNGDGFEDVVVVTTTLFDLQSRELLDQGTPVLLRNSGNDHNWLTLRLVGTDSNRSAIGAKVEVVSGELEQVRELVAGSSFASSESPWPSFGLADNESATVEVTWPSGLVESYQIDEVNRIVTLTEDPPIDFEANSAGQIGGVFAYNLTPVGNGIQVTTQLTNDFLDLGTDAEFDNLVGLYEVVNANGGILQEDGTVLLPSDDPSRYAQLALTNRVDSFELRAGSSGDTNGNTTVEQFGDILLEGGRLYAPFVIANGGTVGFDGFINAENAESDGVFNDAADFREDLVAYFAFSDANPDGAAHLQSRGNNIFGFEDLPSNLGISDNDFNDAIFQISLL